MDIRKYSEGDFQSVVDIYDLSKLDELVEENSQFTLLPLLQDENRNKELFESQIYIYEFESVVAFGAIYNVDIRALFVHPGFRGKGIGEELFRHLLSLASNNVSVYVAASNSCAKKMYSKFGFVVTESFETTYNSAPVVANRMVRVDG